MRLRVRYPAIDWREVVAGVAWGVVALSFILFMVMG